MLPNRQRLNLLSLASYYSEVSTWFSLSITTSRYATLMKHKICYMQTVLIGLSILTCSIAFSSEMTITMILLVEGICVCQWGRCLLTHTSSLHFLRACSIVWLVQSVPTLQKMRKGDWVHSGIRNSPSSENLPACHSIGPLQGKYCSDCYPLILDTISTFRLQMAHKYLQAPWC